MSLNIISNRKPIALNQKVSQAFYPIHFIAGYNNDTTCDLFSGDISLPFPHIFKFVEIWSPQKSLWYNTERNTRFATTPLPLTIGDYPGSAAYFTLFFSQNHDLG